MIPNVIPDDDDDDDDDDGGGGGGGVFCLRGCTGGHFDAFFDIINHGILKENLTDQLPSRNWLLVAGKVVYLSTIYTVYFPGVSRQNAPCQHRLN